VRLLHDGHKSPLRSDLRQLLGPVIASLLTKYHLIQNAKRLKIPPFLLCRFGRGQMPGEIAPLRIRLPNGFDTDCIESRTSLNRDRTGLETALNRDRTESEENNIPTTFPIDPRKAMGRARQTER